MVAYAAVNPTFAAGRFPGYTLSQLVDKTPSMDYAEYAALAMACDAPVPSFESSDARARIFGQAVWNIVRTYELGDFFIRFDPSVPSIDDHYSLRPGGMDWTGGWEVLPDDIKTLRKTYRAMSSLQVMVLTIMRLYNQHKDEIFLIRCPTKKSPLPRR